MSEVQPGDVVAGRFRVERVLGEGGMGVVVAAQNLQLGQRVALKFMREEVASEEYKGRFMREARASGQLTSRHVARVLDVGALEGGAPFMVMEYLEGTDLSALAKKRGKIPVEEAALYVFQACEAVGEAHDLGIVHRDLKPANLFLTRGSGGEPLVKVLDFGVSKVLVGAQATHAGGRGGQPLTVVTKASDMLGSPSYMAPEQVLSAKDVDARSDIWSLGVILFKLTTGRSPFPGGSLAEVVHAILNGEIPRIREVLPDASQEFDDIVHRCLQRDRNLRWPRAADLADALAPFAARAVDVEADERQETRLVSAQALGVAPPARTPLAVPRAVSPSGSVTPATPAGPPAPVASSLPHVAAAALAPSVGTAVMQRGAWVPPGPALAAHAREGRSVPPQTEARARRSSVPLLASLVVVVLSALAVAVALAPRAREASRPADPASAKAPASVPPSSAPPPIVAPASSAPSASASLPPSSSTPAPTASSRPASHGSTTHRTHGGSSSHGGRGASKDPKTPPGPGDAPEIPVTRE